MSLHLEGKSPYRVGEPALARYPLRTSRWHCVGLALGVALASALAVGLLAIDFHGIYLGMAGWALLIASVCVAFWLGTLFPRFCVARGGEIVVNREHVLIPRAFSGPPDDVPLAELELEVQGQPTARTLELEGETRRTISIFTRPTRILIGRRDRPRTLHPSVFTNESHPMRLADDIRRLRAGMALADHENLDVDALFADFEQMFAQMSAGLRQKPLKDDYDDKLDEELRALDAPKKSDQK